MKRLVIYDPGDRVATQLAALPYRWEDCRSKEIGSWSDIPSTTLVVVNDSFLPFFKKIGKKNRDGDSVLVCISFLPKARDGAGIPDPVADLPWDYILNDTNNSTSWLWGDQGSKLWKVTLHSLIALTV